MSDEANTEPKFTFPKVIVTPTLNQIWGDIIKPFTAIAPTNSAFIDATISWEDIGNGYTLDYNSNGILWRVNAGGRPHPDDLDKFYEQQEIIQGYSDNLTAKLKSNINLDKIGIDDGADISEGSSEVGDYMFGHTPNTYNSLGFSSLQLLSSGSELTDADREAGYIRVLLNNGLTYVRVRNEDGQWVIHPDDKQLAQDINNAVAKEMLLSGIVPGLLKVVGSGVKSVYNAFTQESSNATTVLADEVKVLAESPWTKGPIPRGNIIDEAMGNNLGRTFPTVDKLENGVLTSTKSLDVLAPTYQNEASLLGRLKADIDTLSSFAGGRRSGVVVKASDYTSKVLELVLPEAELTAAQLNAINMAKQYASELGIGFRIVVVK